MRQIAKFFVRFTPHAIACSEISRRPFDPEKRRLQLHLPFTDLMPMSCGLFLLKSSSSPFQWSLLLPLLFFEADKKKRTIQKDKINVTSKRGIMFTFK